MALEQINNGETGLVVRTKLNNNTDETNEKLSSTLEASSSKGWVIDKIITWVTANFPKVADTVRNLTNVLSSDYTYSNFTRKVESFAALEAAENVKLGDSITTLSWHVGLNVGGNSFTCVDDEGGSLVANGGTIANCSLSGAVWVAKEKGFVTVKEFGGGTSNYDSVDRDAFQSAIDFVESRAILDTAIESGSRVIHSIKVDAGEHVVVGTLYLSKSGHNIFGEGIQTTIYNSRGFHEESPMDINQIFPTDDRDLNESYLNSKDLFVINKPDEITGLSDHILTNIKISDFSIKAANFNSATFYELAELAKPILFNSNYLYSCLFENITVYQSTGISFYEYSSNKSSLSGCLKNKYVNCKIRRSITSWDFFFNGSILPIVEDYSKTSGKHGILAINTVGLNLKDIYIEDLIYGYYDYSNGAINNVFITNNNDVVFDNDIEINNNFMSGIKAISSTITLSNFKFESVVGASIYIDKDSSIDILTGINEGGVLYDNYTNGGKTYTGNVNSYNILDFGLFDSDKNIPKLPRGGFYIYGKSNIEFLVGGVGTYIVTGGMSSIDISKSTNYYGIIDRITVDVLSDDGKEKSNYISNSMLDKGDTNYTARLDGGASVTITTENEGCYGDKNIKIPLSDSVSTIVDITDSHTDVNTDLNFNFADRDKLLYAIVFSTESDGIYFSIGVSSETSNTSYSIQKRPSISVVSNSKRMVVVCDFISKQTYNADGSVELTDTQGFPLWKIKSQGLISSDNLKIYYTASSNSNLGVVNTSKINKTRFDRNELNISSFKLRGGVGTPEGNIIGKVGDQYNRSDGGVGNTFYIKETGENTLTGWVAK